MKKITLFLFLLLFSTVSHSYFGFGSYVPFPLTTQKDTDGGKQLFTFQPFVSWGGLWSFGTGHFLAPEVGMVYHLSLEDDYSKKTFFLLYNLGYRLSPRALLRYGFGTFMTKISGDGEAVTVRNGSSYATAYQPEESWTSYNTTVNLGLEYAFDSQWAGRFDLYTFEFLDSIKRDYSYAISLTYFP